MNEPAVIASVLDFRIDDVLKTYMRKTGKTEAAVMEEEKLLKRYLALCILYPDATLPMFAVADDLWHEFICHTKLYHRFCAEVATRYIHHQPQMDDRLLVAENSCEPTRSLYEKHFGRAPGSLWASADCTDSGSQCSGNRCSSGDEAHDLPHATARPPLVEV